MNTIDSASVLTTQILELKNKGKIIGFVPTMGALHDGHLNMVKEAKKLCDIVVVSVFINPTQFNNPDDLIKYPRTPENDIKLLESVGCDFAFFPSVEEVYPTHYTKIEVPLGQLDQVMEGAFRAGHFKGVTQVVSRLFDIVQPHKAFFGLKDFQQVAIIKAMVRYLKSDVEIVTCTITRDHSGLALSSRNQRLSLSEKSDALHIYRTLQFAKEQGQTHSPLETKELSTIFFSKGQLKLEYLTIVNPDTLEELTDHWVDHAVMCIACYCGDVRLIDNMQLN